jgi:hypothetical protein
MAVDIDASGHFERGARRNFLGRCHGVVIPTGSNDCIAAHFSAQAMMEI